MFYISSLRYSQRLIVQPIHLAFALLNEGAGESSKPSLFASVVDKAGGDPVSHQCATQQSKFLLTP